MLPNVVLFQGMDATGTDSLWETDGTASGTFALTPISGEPGYGFAPDPGAVFRPDGFQRSGAFQGPIFDNQLWLVDDRRHRHRHKTADRHRRGEFGGDLHCKCLAGLYPLQWRGPVQRLRHRRRLRPVDHKRNGGRHQAEITVNGAASTGVNPSDMTVFNGSVLFNGFDTAGNQGLWTTNGAASGAAEITAHNRGADNRRTRPDRHDRLQRRHPVQRR